MSEAFFVCRGGGAGAEWCGSRNLPPLTSISLSTLSPSPHSHLAVLLFSAERAWAHAQERKAALGSGTATSAARKGLVARAVRAERWGADLARLGGEAGATARTVVEAGAYGAWLAGVAGLERGSDWAGALAALARAQVLTQALASSRSGRLDARAAAQAQLVDREPTLRFAQYQLGLVGGGGSAATATAALVKAKGVVRADPALAAALDAVASEGGGGEEDGGGGDVAASASASTGFATFEWRGGSYPVSSERVRSALATAHKASMAAPPADSGGPSPDSAGARIAALDSAIAALGRAKGAARQAWVSAATSGGGAAGGGGVTAAAEARALALALTGAQLEKALERSQLLVAGLTARMDAGLAAAAAASAGGGHEKAKTTGGKATAPSTTPPLRRARPEELMRAYEAAAKAAKSLGDVASALGGSVGEVLLDEAAAARAGAAAGRAYAAGHAFLAARKPVEAMALFGRAGERAGAAVDAHADCARPDPAAVAGLERLGAVAGVWRGVAHAQAAAAEAATLGAVMGRVSGLQLATPAGGDGGDLSAAPSGPPPVYLTDGPAALGEWASFADGGGSGGGGGGAAPRLAPLPPRLQAVPVRPFVLDLAFDGIVPPDLSHRVPGGGSGGKAGGGGVVAKLFGWGG